MQYYSHYIWESGSEEKDNPVSVILQQVSRKKHHYLLACVCDGREADQEMNSERTMEASNLKKQTEEAMQISSYFTERLTEWFHAYFLDMVLQRKIRTHGIAESLEKELEKIRLELAEYCRQKKRKDRYRVQGILLCDDFFCLFQRGAPGGYLFNRKFNRKKRKKLMEEVGQELIFVQGTVQKKIGILLCTSEFGSSITEEEMIWVLFDDVLDDKKIGKRLREIRQADFEHGVTGAVGAVFMRLE